MLTRSLSDGIVSAENRDYENVRFLQVTVPLNPGNSGGPLFDDEGKVVGVNTFIIRKNQASDVVLEGLNFALQIAYVHELLFEKNKSLDDRSIASILKPQRPGNELANAILEELSQKVQRAESQGFRWYGSDPDTSKKVIEIPARKMYSLTINCTQGDSYLIFAVSRGAPRRRSHDRDRFGNNCRVRYERRRGTSRHVYGQNEWEVRDRHLEPIQFQRRGGRRGIPKNETSDSLEDRGP